MLTYFELPDEDRPPEQIWLDDEAVTAHFESVHARRESSIRGEAVPEADLQQNELTAELRRKP